MVTNKQVRKLFQLLLDDRSIVRAARLTDMDEKTARKYRDLGKLPSEIAKPHDWATRSNPFEAVWGDVLELLAGNSGLQAKTIFGELQRRHPGRFADNQLRTLQRHIKSWRATSGPPKEVFFAQVHEPGRLGASDFTSMNELGVTIQRQRFDHLVYHFVLTYSNWETATICFSESFESLSEGLQNALWKLGAVPERHRTDRMSLAVNNASDQKEFTQRYEGLMAHCGMTPEKIQAGHGNENGDIEQRHHRFKQAVDQALMLRGSRDFVSRTDYDTFLKRLAVKERLDSQLRELRLPSFRSSYEELARQAEQETLSYERYLLNLSDQECQERWRRKIERLLRESCLPLEKTFATFDLKRLPTKVARQVQSLREGGLRGSQGEPDGLRQTGFGENAFVVCVGSRPGAPGAAGSLHDVQPVGAGAVGGAWCITA